VGDRGCAGVWDRPCRGGGRGGRGSCDDTCREPSNDCLEGARRDAVGFDEELELLCGDLLAVDQESREGRSQRF
jgi:hypothetical protein